MLNGVVTCNPPSIASSLGVAALRKLGPEDCLPDAYPAKTDEFDLVKNPLSHRNYGAPGWIRTSDLPLRRRLLYPLSYGRSVARYHSPVAAVPQWVQRPTRV